MFDTTLQVVGINLVTPDPEDGPSDELQMVAVVALMFPTPQGVMPVPAGNVRIPIDREFGLQLAHRLKEECEKLKPVSDIVTATSLSGVDGLAKMSDRLKGAK